MTYIINGKKIDASVGALAICIQLLEALSDKEEKCKWCKAGIPENCAEQSDLAETVARLDKQALKDSEMHEIEIPGPTYSDKEECDCKEKSCKPDCTTKHTCHVYSCEKCNPTKKCETCGCKYQDWNEPCLDDFHGEDRPKQSISLKEVPLRDKIDFIQDRLLNDHVTTEESITEILKLIQSHLVKEMIPPKYTRDMESAGYNQCRGDVIKFICETLSK